MIRVLVLIGCLGDGDTSQEANILHLPVLTPSPGGIHIGVLSSEFQYFHILVISFPKSSGNN
jgi:hypothetical protein